MAKKKKEEQDSKMWFRNKTILGSPETRNPALVLGGRV